MIDYNRNGLSYSDDKLLKALEIIIHFPFIVFYLLKLINLKSMQSSRLTTALRGLQISLFVSSRQDHIQFTFSTSKNRGNNQRAEFRELVENSNLIKLRIPQLEGDKRVGNCCAAKPQTFSFFFVAATGSDVTQFNKF